MALMRLAKDWADSRQRDLTLSVLTVDHGLRADSAEEARRVGEWASSLGLAHHVLAWEGEKPGTGLQARAREARYGLMAGWCRANDAGLILTGHTLDDQAETVLMRLDRSLSPGSLSGIAAKGSWEGIALFRPLLGARRQDLRDYLAALGQDWIEDPSNADPRFERVRVRQALSGLSGQGISPERLASLAEASARTSLLLERLAGQWLTRWLEEEEAGMCHVPKEPFLVLPEALQEHILGRIVRHYGGGQFEPEPEELRRLAGWVRSGSVRCTLGGALMGRRKQGFWAAREPGRISSVPFIIPEGGTAVWDGRFLVKAAPGSSVTPAGRRAVPIGEDVPAFVRRGYPFVEQPAGTEAEPQISILRITTA